MGTITKIEDIRKKWSYRLDADEEEQPKKKKHSAFSTRLPFGLCEDAGIDTTGMTPREAWDAYYGKTGISPDAVKEEKFGGSKSASKGNAVSDAYDKLAKAEEKAKELKGTAKYKEYEKAAQELLDARKAWADAIEANGYDIEKKDYSSLNDEDIEKEYEKISNMEKHAIGLFIDGDERTEKVRELYTAEKEKLIDDVKKRLREKRAEEVGEEEEFDEEGLKTLDDAELEELDEEVWGQREWYADRVRKWSGKRAEREAAKSMRDEMDRNLEKINTERDRRAELDVHEKYSSIGEARPTARAYKSPSLQAYAKKVKPPVVNTGIATLENWQKSADAYMNNAFDQKWNMDADQLEKLQANLQKIMDGAEFCVNINSENVEKVFATHLKNQFETGTSDGMEDLDARSRMSHNIFGTDYGAEDVEREKFGFIADKDDYKGTLGSAGPSYGESGNGNRCTIVLKKDNLADRTTYTFADSLCGCVDDRHEQFAAGVVDKTCSVEGLSYRLSYAKGIADGTIKSIDDINGHLGGFGYVECQMHGLVTAKDIDSVRFKSISELRSSINAWGNGAMEIAKENGIRFAYYDQLDSKFVYMTAEEASERAKRLY